MARSVPSRALCALVVCATLATCKRDTPGGFGAIVEAESLGATYLDANDLPKAEEAYKHLIALAPTDASARTKLGIVYVRMNRPKDAEQQFQESAKLDTTSVDARLLLASLMSANGNRDAARQTLDGLTKRTPVDPKVYYALAELARTDPDSVKGRADARAALESLAKLVPGNVPVRLALARAFVATADNDGALRELESLEQLPPSLPREARPSFDQSVDALRKNNSAAAAADLATFQHFLEVTVPFQSGLEVLRAPQIAVSGMPQLTLPTTESMRTRLAAGNADAPVVFTDGSARFPTMPVSAKGPFALAVGDYDGDGSDDFFVSTGAGRAMLMHWQDGQWIDAADKAGVNVVGAVSAVFADVDGDGRLDLFVIDGAGKGYLYMNDGSGHFHDVAAKAGLADPGVASKIIAADMDHDGDIDIVLATPRGIRFYRNNSDGTFLDATAAVGLGAAGDRESVAFADLDDDGMLDLVAVGNAGSVFYHNTHDRRFDDHTAASGLAAHGSVVAVADYDNDGYLDVFAGGVLYRNMHDGNFSRDDRATAALASLSTLTIRDAVFVDYDNDGFQDLVIVGTPTRGNGVRLLHNDGNGKFSDRSSILPHVGDASVVAATDLDRDRDIDLLVVGPSGFRALRNDGGNRNLAIQVRLTGLTTGSGKNNALGIGATLEVRVGDVYQRRIVTERVTTIGLGHHLKADVVRVEWPNGVPETIYYPGSDQDVVENQVLKSSCGFLYAWNGTRFEFVTDVMWRSALGMPVGIGGNGTASFAPAAASKEYLKIPRGALVAKDGRYRVQLTEELWETSYTDQVALVAVDHPDSVDAVVDERFIPPGPPVNLNLYATRQVHPPVSVVDDRGTDLMPELRDADFRYAADFDLGKFQGITTPHDLVVDLGPDLGSGQVLLMLRGWVFPTDASVNVSIAQGKGVTVMWPVLDVKNRDGQWKPAVTDLSIPSGKNKLVVVDLTGKFASSDHHVRIRTNVEIYWDQVSVATTAPKSPTTVTRLQSVSADTHYRGFSRMFRKGGRYGPHWFDYADVTREPAWRPIAGKFTRYGDVNALLQSSDDEYIVMSPGDETTIDFDAAAAPPLPKGWVRDLFLYSDGWIKDADLNTANGASVTPLPFHAMSRYPYGAGEQYPSDAAHKAYMARYNTREMNPNWSLRDAKR